MQTVFLFSLSHSMELGLTLVRRHVQNIFLVLEDTAFNLAVNCQQALWAFLCHENPIYFSLFPRKHLERVHYTQQYYWAELALVPCFCWLSTWFLFPRLLKQLFSGVKASQKAKGIEIQRGLIFTLSYTKSKGNCKIRPNFSRLIEWERHPTPTTAFEGVTFSWNTACSSPMNLHQASWGGTPLCRLPVGFFSFVYNILSKEGQSHFIDLHQQTLPKSCALKKLRIPAIAETLAGPALTCGHSTLSAFTAWFSAGAFRDSGSYVHGDHNGNGLLLYTSCVLTLESLFPDTLSHRVRWQSLGCWVPRGTGSSRRILWTSGLPPPLPLPPPWPAG